MQEIRTERLLMRAFRESDYDDLFEFLSQLIDDEFEGYSGFLFLDDDGMPLAAMHREHRFNHMVKRYNEIFREQMPNITPHVCRHTYCSIQARAGMHPKMLQYLMGHSVIGATMNTYMHLGLEDALEEVGRMKELENAGKEQEKLADKKGRAEDKQEDVPGRKTGQ